MKFIKKFENYTNMPEVGDYVFMTTYSPKKYHQNFFKKNIGQVVNYNGGLGIEVRYTNIPKQLMSLFLYNVKYNGYVKTFNINKIVDFAKTEELLKKQVEFDTRKYNL